MSDAMAFRLPRFWGSLRRDKHEEAEHARYVSETIGKIDLLAGEISDLANELLDDDHEQERRRADHG